GSIGRAGWENPPLPWLEPGGCCAADRQAAPADRAEVQEATLRRRGPRPSRCRSRRRDSDGRVEEAAPPTRQGQTAATQTARRGSGGSAWIPRERSTCVTTPTISGRYGSKVSARITLHPETLLVLRRITGNGCPFGG